MRKVLMSKSLYAFIVYFASGYTAVWERVYISMSGITTSKVSASSVVPHR